MAKPVKAGQPMRPRRIFFGPGIVIALALSFYIIKQEGLLDRRSQPPVIEHRAPSSRPEQPPAADIEFLLERAGELRLTDEQVRELRGLRKEWQKETADQRAAADRAATEFEEFMKQTSEAGKPAPLTEIRRRAAEVSELSAALSAARRAYWERALLVLGPDQRESAERALREHLKLSPRSPPAKDT